uniref:Phage-related protein n=1 Tax=uncultured bacterium A1Q1_fos_25 TaxID=1256569 RepID=L7W0G1_9BACT|nr:phage-related protein [uncultured bacterium A1Q1_fos_25]
MRETFAIVHGCRDPETGYIDDWMVPSDIPKDDNGGFWVAIYRANDRFEESKEDRGFSWRPAIHMPRWACRLVLPLVSVRVERVQDITDEDAEAEGVEPIEGSYREGFRAMWQDIYATWDANPWVWVAEWKEIEVSR